MSGRIPLTESPYEKNPYVNFLCKTFQHHKCPGVVLIDEIEHECRCDCHRDLEEIRD